MAKVKVIYASFPYVEITASAHAVFISERVLQLRPEVILGNNIESLEAATEQGVKKIGGALGWGVVGGVIAGPLGAIAGAVLGGNHRETAFTLVMKDGRRLIGTVETGIFNALVAQKMRFNTVPAPQVVEEWPQPTFDDEMQMKADRMYAEPDYYAWKKRTGEIEKIKAWMFATGYTPAVTHPEIAALLRNT